MNEPSTQSILEWVSTEKLKQYSLDSKGIQKYLFKKYKKKSAFIAYGADLVTETNESLLKEKGIKKYEYNLLVARMPILITQLLSKIC